MDIELKVLANNLISIRKSKKLTVQQLAKKSHTSVGTISTIENGYGNPLIGTLNKLANGLKIDLTILVKGI